MSGQCSEGPAQILRCPVCGEALHNNGKSRICPRGHCFDNAAKGYVNLYLSGGSGGHGDDRLMVNARTAFLNGGWYAPLAEKLAELAAEYAGPGSVIVDAGCGEGYYTAAVQEASGAGVIGIDLSKYALIAAAKRSRKPELVLASTAAMPLADGSADMVLNVFSPLFGEEFARVLRPGGLLVRVVPLERHLWELKELVYDSPYENDAPLIPLAGFAHERTERVEYTVTLKDKEAVRQLFMMTPYYYKTGERDQRKLETLEELTTLVSFGVLLYRRQD